MTRHAYYLTVRGPVPVRIVDDHGGGHPLRASVLFLADVGAYHRGDTFTVSGTFLVDRLAHRWTATDGADRCISCGLDEHHAPTRCDPHDLDRLDRQEHTA